ncbi:hypothetical protein [Flavobacterium sp. GCM10023249]|uniref:hypothetical protein n=1 Tax=unclassified Flavobacterium TaxID=196869 RepID=UPI0036111F70
MKFIFFNLFLFTSVFSFGQSIEKKPIQIQFEHFIINKESKTGIQKGRNPLSLLVLEEKDIESYKSKQPSHFDPKNCTLNYKISPEGKFYFVKGSVGIKKKSVPEELKGIPQFDYEYYNDSTLIDFLNDKFSKLNLNYVFIQNGTKMTDFTEFSDITFVRSFYFQIK